MFAAEGTDRLAKSSGEVEGDEANAGQCVSGVAGASSAGVFTQRRIEHIEAAVFDVPAATQVFQQECGVGLVAGEAADGVGHALPSLALLDGVAFQANQWLRAGPVEVALVDEARRGGDGARFQTAAALLLGRGGLLVGLGFTHGVGGKSFVESRRLARCRAGVAVDSA